MKSNMISVEEAISNKNLKYVDVRAPIEHEEAKIPHAVNLPLFDNQERALLGTVYRQNSPEEATEVGKEIVTARIPELLEKLRDLVNGDQEILLYCWRGGMRSQSLAYLCWENDLPVKVLQGGYNAFRRHVYQYWQQPLGNRVAVLYGLSGVGKTKVLNNMAEMGAAVLNLENLAGNRGSVFGKINGVEPPSQKDFEAQLFMYCRQLTPNEVIFTECEGKRIGNIHLPKSLFSAMETGYRIHLYADVKTRVNNIVTDYAQLGAVHLIKQAKLLTKFLGREKVSKLINLINEGNLREAAEIMLIDYYDPLYGYCDKKDFNYELSVNCNDSYEAATEIINFIKAR